jgi:hypothetical protein
MTELDHEGARRGSGESDDEMDSMSKINETKSLTTVNASVHTAPIKDHLTLASSSDILSFYLLINTIDTANCNCYRPLFNYFIQCIGHRSL